MESYFVIRHKDYSRKYYREGNIRWVIGMYEATLYSTKDRELMKHTLVESSIWQQVPKRKIRKVLNRKMVQKLTGE
jgi:hypothetical protein